MKENVQLIFDQFPDLSDLQKKQFSDLYDLYQLWNNQINVISRKDTEHFYERHVLHSLGIAKVQSFLPGTMVLDVGTGGGFPGIPLAILFPETKFTLVDSIGKKIKVVKEVAEALGLENVKAINDRAENILVSYDFIISRAVTKMPEFMAWVKNKTKSKSQHELKNGILYLKGGDLTEEMAQVKNKITYYDLSSYFDQEFFETKKVVHVVI
jgi:16S rRNA (guanine527-N7)-methyltransferase|tara:strand:- start:644 stop:1276 length:633 start_codon:yes stop_codon:yes gene_type:complete